MLQFSLVGFSVSLVSSAFYFLKVAGLLIILFLVSIAVRGLFFKKNFFCFLMSLTNGLSILFILSNNKLLALLIFFYGLLCFFCIYFCPNFKDFFPSANPRVLHFFFFLVALDVKLGYLFIFSLVS